MWFGWYYEITLLRLWWGGMEMNGAAVQDNTAPLLQRTDDKRPPSCDVRYYLLLRATKN